MAKNKTVVDGVEVETTDTPSAFQVNAETGEVGASADGGNSEVKKTRQTLALRGLAALHIKKSLHDKLAVAGSVIDLTAGEVFDKFYAEEFERLVDSTLTDKLNGSLQESVAAKMAKLNLGGTV